MRPRRVFPRRDSSSLPMTCDWPRVPYMQAVQDVHAEANGAIRTFLGQLLAPRAPG